MANIKITDLTAYTDPASTDVLPIVDVGSDVTKKVSIADLLENAGSGTEALPGIAFDGDPSTGIYRPGAGQLAISSNGTERVEFGTSEVVFNDGGANYDFRIEGDTSSSLFFVDASANAVGIGTAIPDRILDIESAGSAEIKLTDSTNIGRHMYIKNNDGAFEFRARDRNSDGSFVFLGYGSGVDNEFMRINSSGKLLVGISSGSGSLANRQPVVAGTFSTINGSVSVSTGATVTMFTLPNENASFLVNVCIKNVNSTSFNGCYFVAKNRASATTAVAIRASNGCPVTVSGDDVQVTQSTGTTRTVFYNVIKVGSFGV